MAQLHSIKHVIDRLKRVHADDNVPPAIYLLDEILNGTNTSDRRTLVEQLIGFTLQCRAIGAITSHDLQLAADYLQSKAIRNLCMGHHTTEMNGADDLHFDYKLRNGISTEGSAVILARILGLDRTAPTEEL